jgi:hypothetical protein
MNKNTLIFLIFAVIAIVVIVFIVFPKPCLVPPPETNQSDSSQAGELAAKLEKLKDSADVKESYKSVINTTYGKLSQRNVELYLYLKTIDCLKIKPDLAKEIVIIVRAKYGNEHGNESLDSQLTNAEKKDLSETDAGRYVLRQFQAYGF